MITVKIKNRRFRRKQKIQIPTDWSDLTVIQFMRMLNAKDDIEIAEILTGLDLASFHKVRPFLNFIDQTLDISGIEPREYVTIGDKFFKVPDIGTSEYGQKIYFEQCYRKSIAADTVMQDFAGIISIYLQPMITGSHFEIDRLPEAKNTIEKMPMLDAFGVHLNLISQLNRIHEGEKSLVIKPTFEQITAGIETFNELGEFNTLDNIASKYGYTHEQVERLEYNLIFLILRKQNISSIFEKNYAEAMKPKK